MFLSIQDVSFLLQPNYRIIFQIVQSVELQKFKLGVNAFSLGMAGP